MPVIVVPKRKPNTILAHLLENITPESTGAAATRPPNYSAPSCVAFSRQPSRNRRYLLGVTLRLRRPGHRTGRGVWATFAPGIAVTVPATAARML
jgi:hypothetical protein